MSPDQEINQVPDEARIFSAEKKAGTTPETLRRGANFLIDSTLKSFKIEGEENLTGLGDSKAVIAQSHLSNLDAPAAVKALGERFDLQLAVQSLLFDRFPHKYLIAGGGKENFSPLAYKKTSADLAGQFNPADFDGIQQKMAEGKTPWIAASPFTLAEKMRPVAVGPVYLAQKSRAKIIPTALEIKGSNISFEGPGKIIKGLTKKQAAVYHIGRPIELEPLDVSIIENLLNKRKRKLEKVRKGEPLSAEDKITPEEKKAFGAVHQALKEQAKMLGQKISELLPPKQRGHYFEIEEAADKK